MIWFEELLIGRPEHIGELLDAVLTLGEVVRDTGAEIVRVTLQNASSAVLRLRHVSTGVQSFHGAADLVNVAPRGRTGTGPEAGRVGRRGGPGVRGTERPHVAEHASAGRAAGTGRGAAGSDVLPARGIARVHDRVSRRHAGRSHRTARTRSSPPRRRMASRSRRPSRISRPASCCRSRRPRSTSSSSPQLLASARTSQ